MPDIASKQKTYGLFAALAAFFAWGLLPIYWKSLIVVNPVEILCHRIIWSLVFIAIILTILKGWKETFASMRSPKDIGILILSSLMIGGNWLLYIWAVNTNHVLETSLGYFINPLVTTLLGYIFFRERLKPLQLVAIGLATLGVANSIFSYGELPWISLTLALSFAFYGLLRKIASVESLPGLFLETMVLAPLALTYLIKMQMDGTSAFFTVSPTIDLLLIGAGAATATPLIGFAYGARRLQLSTLGVLQYVGPSIAFILGVYVYKEPFTASHLVTFTLIWSGLAVYTGESIWSMRTHRRLTRKK
nr:EamA family transporter RarD [Pseudodesulfovibrio sp.]